MSRAHVLSIQSHVVHGYVGNRCATFCLQRLGIDVDALNTVQFSNHAGYPILQGSVRTGKEVLELYKGLELNRRDRHSHVLTGYMRSMEMLASVVEVVQRARAKRPELIFVCDPVMGDNGKAYLPEELVAVYRRDVIPLADVLLPNQFETELLTERTIRDIPSAASACAELHAMGPQTVIITSLEDPNGPEGSLTLYGSTTLEQAPSHYKAFKIHIPRIDYEFTGAGDLLAALILALMAKRPLELDWVCAQATSRLHSLLSLTYASRESQDSHLELRLVPFQHCLLSCDDPFRVIPAS